MTDSSKYDIIKDHSIVVVMNGVENLVFIPIQYTAKERDVPSRSDLTFIIHQSINLTIYSI